MQSYHFKGSLFILLISFLIILSVLDRLYHLGNEVSLDYERTMNKINFDRIVTSKPQTFSYVTLPEKEEETVPEKGRWLSTK